MPRKKRKPRKPVWGLPKAPKKTSKPPGNLTESVDQGIGSWAIGDAPKPPRTPKSPRRQPGATTKSPRRLPGATPKSPRRQAGATPKSPRRQGGPVGGMGSGLAGPWSGTGKGSKISKFAKSNTWKTNRNFHGYKRWGKSKRTRRDAVAGLPQPPIGTIPVSGVLTEQPRKKKRTRRK